MATVLDDAMTAQGALDSDITITSPTRQELIEQICLETHCTTSKAKRFVNWMEGIVARTRKSDHASHYLTDDELRCHHPILDTIAPDGSVAEPGSAHDMLEQHLLDPEMGEIGLLHDMADEPDSPRYCTVQVRLSVRNVGRSGGS